MICKLVRSFSWSFAARFYIFIWENQFASSGDLAEHGWQRTALLNAPKLSSPISCSRLKCNDKPFSHAPRNRNWIQIRKIVHEHDMVRYSQSFPNSASSANFGFFPVAGKPRYGTALACWVGVVAWMLVGPGLTMPETGLRFGGLPGLLLIERRDAKALLVSKLWKPQNSCSIPFLLLSLPQQPFNQPLIQLIYCQVRNTLLIMIVCCGQHVVVQFFGYESGEKSSSIRKLGLISCAWRACSLCESTTTRRL